MKLMNLMKFVRMQSAWCKGEHVATRCPYGLACPLAHGAKAALQLELVQGFVARVGTAAWRLVIVAATRKPRGPPRLRRASLHLSGFSDANIHRFIIRRF